MDKGPGVGEHLESWGTGVRVKLSELESKGPWGRGEWRDRLGG